MNSKLNLIILTETPLLSAIIRSKLRTIIDFEFELFHIDDLAQYTSISESDDLYIVDHEMRSAGSICHQLLEQRNPIVLISNESRIEEHREFIDSGVEEILLKEELTGSILYRKITYALQRDVLEQKRVEQIENSNKKADEYHSRLLGSNMNPHFIFNILTSLQYYILESKKEDALSFLSRFSRLIRATLDNSREEMISLEEEIEFLRQYIDVQKERYGFDFNLGFRINSEFDPADYAIPPLLLQPFVENAIMHGLRYKLGNDSLLELEIELENQQLIYRVLDSGPGMSKKSKSLHGRKSHALEIARERIHLLNRQGYKSFDLKIENRLERSGTLVQLNSPLIEY